MRKRKKEESPFALPTIFFLSNFISRTGRGKGRIHLGKKKGGEKEKKKGGRRGRTPNSTRGLLCVRFLLRGRMQENGRKEVQKKRKKEKREDIVPDRRQFQIARHRYLADIENELGREKRGLWKGRERRKERKKGEKERAPSRSFHLLLLYLGGGGFREGGEKGREKKTKAAVSSSFYFSYVVDLVPLTRS